MIVSPVISEATPIKSLTRLPYCELKKDGTKAHAKLDREKPGGLNPTKNETQPRKAWSGRGGLLVRTFSNSHLLLKFIFLF